MYFSPINSPPIPTHSHLLISKMALSGFEGFEKRLELHFSGDDPLGLRLLPIESIQQVLDAVQCSIVSAASNLHFDSYVLSESSLFVYPHKIIIKTCGTTQLLKSITCLLNHTAFMNLHLHHCRYTRGSFIFPKAQPFPHTSFTDEVLFLEQTLPTTLCYRKARVLLSKTSHSWHVYTATDLCMAAAPPAGVLTVEVCMTELDRVLAKRFYRRKGECEATGHEAGKEMTELSGIDGINPRALICDFAFEPCGYSMNGLDRDRYSTIHVTPEDGYSYASFECVVRAAGAEEEITDVIRRAARVFRPGSISVSVCMQSENDGLVWKAVTDALKPLGMSCRSRVAEGFPGVGTVSYQTFISRRK
ncbi:putative adenosylmethionine decarboxylase [Dioscorea sansibarensis]